MPTDITEFQRELQNIISEALAAGIPAETLIDALSSAVEDLEAQNGAANDDDPAA